MTRLERIILDTRIVQWIIKLAKFIKLPGKERLSLYEISVFFFGELKNNRLFDRCAAVTYNFVMAMPPTLLVLFSLVPYLPLSGVKRTILDTLRIITPNERIYDQAGAIITDFMDNEQTGVLSFGILLTLFFSSNGMMGLIRSFERKHLSVHVKRNGLKQRWVAIKMTVLLLLLGLTSIIVLIFQSRALNDFLLGHFGGNIYVVNLTRWISLIIVALIIFNVIAIIYRYGPSLTHRVKYVSPGAVFSTFLCLITSAVFFFLVNNFIHYNKVYGSIGTLMAFMVWIWLNTLVILIGYDLNVSVLLGKISRQENGSKKKTT